MEHPQQTRQPKNTQQPKNKNATLPLEPQKRKPRHHCQENHRKTEPTPKRILRIRPRRLQNPRELAAQAEGIER
jgi:hypothetical protein